MAKKKRSAAQKAATKRMLAARHKNPRKKGRGKGKGRKGNPGKHRRRRNPGADGFAGAFLGGFLGRPVGTAVSEGLEHLAGHGKHSMMRTAARVVGRLSPLGVAYMIRDKHPNAALGMVGVSAAGTQEELLHHAVHGAKMPAWAPWLGLVSKGGPLEVPGGQIHVDAKQGPMFTPAPNPNAPDGTPPPPPAPVVAMQGPEFTLRNEDGDRRMKCVAQLPDGQLLMMDKRTRQFDTVSGLTVPELRGIVQVSGILEVTRAPLSGIVEESAAAERATHPQVSGEELDGIVQMNGESMDGIVQMNGEELPSL